MRGDTSRPSLEKIDRIRQTIGATVEDWLQDYGLCPDKAHLQLVNRVVGAILALHQSDLLEIGSADRE